LHAASDYGQFEVVQYLLEQGADLLLTDASNRTAIDHALLGKQSLLRNDLWIRTRVLRWAKLHVVFVIVKFAEKDIVTAAI